MSGSSDGWVSMEKILQAHEAEAEVVAARLEGIARLMSGADPFFTCETCDKKFTSRKSLGHHRRSHREVA